MVSELMLVDDGLVKVYEYKKEKERTVNAKELYDFLKIETPFHKWINRRIEKYGFESGLDFWTIQGESSGGRPPMEYYLTISASICIVSKEKTQKQPELLKLLIEINDNIIVQIRESNRKEIEFGNLLESVLNGITIGSAQRWGKSFDFLQLKKQSSFNNGQYRVDFTIPGFSIAIEYDEQHHNYKDNYDKNRMEEINSKFWLLEGFEENDNPPTWIRVKEGKEADGLKEIMIELSKQDALI